MANSNNFRPASLLEESAAWISGVLRGPVFAVAAAAAAAVYSTVNHWSQSQQNKLCCERKHTIEFFGSWMEDSVLN